MKNKLLTLLFVGLAFVGHTQLTIDNINTTESTCPNNGTAEIQVSGGSGNYEYLIDGGNAQTSNTFLSLAPGTYTFTVFDRTDNVQVDQDATITGNYQAPSLSFDTTTETCPGDNDASITVNTTNGLAPFSYEIISPSTVGPQTSNVFNNLAPGDYQIRVTDDCGSAVTQDITVDPYSYPTSVGISNISATITNCTAPREYNFRIETGTSPSNFLDESPGRTLEYLLYDGTSNAGTLIAQFDDVPGFDEITLPAPSSGSHFVEVREKACGNVLATASTTYTTTIDDIVGTPTITENCDGTTSEVIWGYNRNSNIVTCTEMTGEVRDLSGNVLFTTTTNDGGEQNRPSRALRFDSVPFGDYELCIMNCCGEEFCTPVEVVPPPAPSISHFLSPRASCQDGLTGVSLDWSGIPASPRMQIALIDGPSETVNEQGDVFTSNYSPGDLILGNFAGSSGRLTLHNLAPGEYQFGFISSCNDTIPYNVVIDDTATVRDVDFQTEIIPGCGANSNEFRVSGFDNTDGIYDIEVFVDGVSVDSFVGNGNNTFSVTNLGAGSVRTEITLRRRTNGASRARFYSGGCQSFTINDTIEPYVGPDFSVDGFSCTTSTDFVIDANATRGVGPYTYTFYEGTDNTGTELATQPSNGVFEVSNSNSYYVEVEDACGNILGRQVTFGTFSPPSIDVDVQCTSTAGSDEVTLSSTVYSSQNIDYEWRDPDGNVIGTNSNTVSLPNFTTADNGDYTLTATIGCATSTATANVTNTTCVPLPLDLIDFEASKRSESNSVLLWWKTANEVDFSHFDIEYSTDGILFNSLAIEVAMGSGTDYTEYSYIHDGALNVNNTLYYRLKMVDLDGSFEYSDIQVISKDELESDIKLFPNPVPNGQLTITGTLYEGEYRVHDFMGRIRHIETLDSQSDALIMNLSRLKPGIYLVTMPNGNKGITTKRIIIR